MPQHFAAIVPPEDHETRRVIDSRKAPKTGEPISGE
jgi:hypothetical protein